MQKNVDEGSLEEEWPMLFNRIEEACAMQANILWSPSPPKGKFELLWTWQKDLSNE